MNDLVSCPGDCLKKLVGLQAPHPALSPAGGEDKGEGERCQNFGTYFRDATLVQSRQVGIREGWIRMVVGH
ncbi:MAG: hypothetical protein M3Z35_09650, partial [Nitrospirota bacterium]|nr:hypothetical protein [Nitrospirota bacterium]